MHKNVKGKQAFTGVRAPGGLPSFPEPVSRASGTVVIIIIQDKAKHDASPPTSARMPRLKFFGKLHHFCIRYQALYVPQLLIEKMKLVDFWSGSVPSRSVPFRRPSRRETPVFKQVHPFAYAPASLNVQLFTLSSGRKK